MKSSAALAALAILAIAASAFNLVLLPSFASSQSSEAGDFEVAFDEQPALDHVCFLIDVKSKMKGLSSIPFKPILNATSIDLGKAEVKLYAEREQPYTVTSCNSCKTEYCTRDNGTGKDSCGKMEITDCGLCGSTESTATKTVWDEVLLSPNGKIMNGIKNELRNEFSRVTLNVGKKERYRMCYYFNEIPINPSTGMPGSYGFMYLDLGGKLYYDFEHSSWWNTSVNYRVWVNTTATYPTSIVPFRVFDDNITEKTTENDFEEEGWLTNKSMRVLTTGCYYHSGVTGNNTIDRKYPSGDYQSSWEGYTCGSPSSYTCNSNAYMIIDLGSERNISGVITYFQENREGNLDVNYSTNNVDYYDYDYVSLAEVQSLEKQNRSGAGMYNETVVEMSGLATARYLRYQVTTVEAQYCDFDIVETFVKLDDSDVLWKIQDGNKIVFNTSEGNMTVYGKNITDADAGSHLQVSDHRCWIPVWDTDDQKFYIYYNETGICGTESSWSNPSTANWNGIGEEENQVWNVSSLLDVVIINPQNTTYNKTTHSLEIVTSDGNATCTYSIDGGQNISIPHNYEEGQYIDSWIPNETNGMVAIEGNGTRIWGMGWTPEYNITIFEYYSNWTYTGRSFNLLTSENTVPVGLERNETQFWIADVGRAEIAMYSLNGTYMSNWSLEDSIDESGMDSLNGIATDGTYIYLTGFGGNYIYTFFMNGTYIRKWTTCSTPLGLSYIGNEQLLISCDDGNVVTTVFTNGTYAGSSWQETQSETPIDIYSDGIYAYIVGIFNGGASPRKILKYYATDGWGNVYTTSMISLTNGSHKVDFYCNDTIGNINSSTVYFTIDNSPPTLTILSPSSDTQWNYATSDFKINGTCTDDEGVSVIYTDSNIWQLYTSTSPFSVTNSTWIPTGSQNFHIYCNDTANNVVSKQISMQHLIQVNIN